MLVIYTSNLQIKVIILITLNLKVFFNFEKLWNLQIYFYLAIFLVSLDFLEKSQLFRLSIFYLCQCKNNTNNLFKTLLYYIRFYIIIYKLYFI